MAEKFIPPPRARRVDGVTAPLPYLCAGKPYDNFRELQRVVEEATGHPFLSVCGDMLRAGDFHSDKAGVAERSWHKTGRAFDYNQGSPLIVLVREPVRGRNFFRTYLRCGERSGQQLGEKRTLPQWSRRSTSRTTGYFFDFTAAAERLSYFRIPSWKGWESGNWNKLEFWHYQSDGNMSWEEAMRYLYHADTPSDFTPSVIGRTRTIGRNDRGSLVRRAQLIFAGLDMLPARETDGIFGLLTFSVTIQYQTNKAKTNPGLAVSGRIDPQTWALLEDDARRYKIDLSNS
jgi:hypothetical protein